MATSGYQIVTFKTFAAPNGPVNQLVQNQTLLRQRLAENLGQREIPGVRQESIDLQLEAHTLRHQLSRAEAKAGTGTATAHFQP